MKEADYLIVGAGPAGSYLAEKLALKGFKVILADKKKTVGKPVQCTGLITEELKKYVDISEGFVKNVTKKVEIYSKNESFAVNSKEYIIDRFEFDNYLLGKSEDAGAKILLGSEFLGEKNGKIIMSKESITARTKCFGLIKRMNYFLGKQYLIRMRSSPEAYKVYFDEKFRDFFAWIVPVSKTVSRVGIASKDMPSVNEKLKYFMNSRKIKGKILETNAGLIPLFNPLNSNHVKRLGMNVYLFGDASGLVKASTGGGIIPAFNSIDKSLPEIILGRTPKLLGIKKELILHLIAHNIMGNFKDTDYDSLITDAKDSRVKSVIEKISRDNFGLMALKLFLKKPGLVKYFKLY